jgi:uncharacterized protein (DUF305 family)
MRRWLLSLALCVSAASFAQHAHDHVRSAPPEAVPAGDARYARFVREMEAGMRAMMNDMHAPGYTGDPDIDFLAMMIPHHQGAVEMARLQLLHGRDPAARRLAEDIIASQTVEIEGMKRRLAALRAASRHDPEPFPALGGTRGPAR